jgi:hypothetical protein
MEISFKYMFTIVKKYSIIENTFIVLIFIKSYLNIYFLHILQYFDLYSLTIIK